ncbi:hypothetical protein GQ41_3353 [Arenibacter algicola]|uniref:Uncharacterized protein n=1 Tax=Arenibacter algicola TaxID=616991 RepID=A0ABY3AE70_9FLAO
MLDNKITHLFKTNLRFKDLCVDMLSRQYGFFTKQINAYKNILNFKESYLVYNRNVIWDLKTIDNTKDKIDWSGFYKFKGIELNLSFFKKYEDYIKFQNTQLNKNIDWSNQLLDRYADRWEWEWLMMRAIVASPRNIAKYKDRYDWDKLSSNRHLKLTEDLLDTYLENWNWIKLSSNSSLVLDKRSIEKYKDQLCFNGLSRNPSMVPFILAYPNNYDWNWVTFSQNRGVVFGDKIIQFLIEKFKANQTYLKGYSVGLQNNFAKGSLILAVSNNLNFNRDIWFSESFIEHIPWKLLIQRKPDVLTTQEIEDHINLEDFIKILPYNVIQKLSKQYILNNLEVLLKFRWSLFRYANIDEVFVKTYAIEDDWFQLAFNTRFNWSLEFLLAHLDKFESNNGLSQNENLFESLFGSATKEEIENLLKVY